MSETTAVSKESTAPREEAALVPPVDVIEHLEGALDGLRFRRPPEQFHGEEVVGCAADLGSRVTVGEPRCVVAHADQRVGG